MLPGRRDAERTTLRGRTARGSWPAFGLVAFLVMTALSGWAAAQDEVRNYRKPILVVETGGHHSRVRGMTWLDDDTLLTAGEDKVVKVWDFKDGPRLVRTLRPLIWRGLGGAIFTMTATKPDAQGQAFVAVAGYGVENRRGDITVFRVPGLDVGPQKDARIPSGEVVTRLMPPTDEPGQIGHVNVVLALAFDPGGTVLASGSADRRIILWDVPTFKPRYVLEGHEGDVRALAFSPDGLRLASVGSDGSIRTWDVRTGQPLETRPGNKQRPVAINAVAFGPSLVVGRENGNLFRFDARSLLRFPPAVLPTPPNQGPVEFLKFSPNGAMLAICSKTENTEVLDPMTFASDLELRAMPGGETLKKHHLSGQILTCAFSPSGSRLAYAGGHTQSIFVQDLARLEAPPQELKGQGSTPFDLGFTEDSQTVGFIRQAPAGANPPYDSFNFATRTAGRVNQGQLQRARLTLNGWSLQGNRNAYQLRAVNADGRQTRLFDLDRNVERNWWSQTMIPPGPGHPRPTVAIGCEQGIVIYDLETGDRTRVFAGHGGPVVSVVPSPDGRWLASSSLDQTILIYPLVGCDARPGLGATFQQRPDRSWAVADVAPHEAAAGMGLRKGDVLTFGGIGRGGTRTDFDTPEKLGAFLEQANAALPSLDVIAIRRKRTILLPDLMGVVELNLPLVGTTKRTNPLISLMQSVDKEWIVWTPQGFYDTSIEGDTRLLGWHINPDYRSSRATDFVPMSTYQETMHQPRVLEQLWRLGDLEQAVAAAGLPPGLPTLDTLAYQSQPPRIRFGPVASGVRLPAPGVFWTVSIPNPQIEVSYSAPEWSRLSQRRVIVDDQTLALPPLAAPMTQHSEVIPLQLVPRRRVRVAVEAVSQNQTRRTETIDLIYLPVPGQDAADAVPSTPGRLIVLSIGNQDSTNPEALPPVLFADRDAKRLASSLTEHLVTRDGVKCVSNVESDQVLLTGEKATAKQVDDAFGRLFQRVEQHQLQKEDTVAVVIASHLLDLGGGGLGAIAMADSQTSEKTISPAVGASDLAELLGNIADYGCRVILFIDGVHDLSGKTFKSEIKPLVRDLQQNRRVITVVASKEGPSDVSLRDEAGVFAQGVAGALEGAGNAPFTIAAFREQLRRNVHELSERFQEAEVYLPIQVDPRAPFSKP